MFAKLNVIVCHVQNKVLHHALSLVPGIVIFIVVVVVIVALATCIAMQ